MNIDYIVSQFNHAVSDIKQAVAQPLTTRQKIIAAIAYAALGIIISYLMYRCYYAVNRRLSPQSSKMENALPKNVENIKSHNPSQKEAMSVARANGENRPADVENAHCGNK